LLNVDAIDELELQPYTVWRRLFSKQSLLHINFSIYTNAYLR